MNLGRNKKSQRGFSLVELMVVVAIIGILTGIAVPRFQTFKARAIQTEGKTGLNGVFLAMQAYEANYAEWPLFTGLATGAGIGFAVNGAQQKYQYRIVSQPNPAAWAASANTIARLANNRFDNMRMSGNKWLCSSFDAVQNAAAVPWPQLNAGNASGNGRRCPQSSPGTSATWAPTLTTPSDFTTM